MTISTGTLQMHRLHPAFGVGIEGVDLRRSLDDGTWAHIWEGFNEHSLLLFHDQPLTDDEQMRFSLRFGPLETTIKTLGKEDRLHPNLVELANVDENGRLMDWADKRMLYQSGNQLWHSDSSFKKVPAHASHIEGMPVEEGRALLKELVELATRQERVYRHAWRQHDLVIWDNRCLLHRGRPWDAKRHTRVMHRTTVAGDGPTA